MSHEQAILDFCAVTGASTDVAENYLQVPKSLSRDLWACQCPVTMSGIGELIEDLVGC